MAFSTPSPFGQASSGGGQPGTTLFGSPATGSVFGQLQSQPTLFGQPQSQPSLFGQPQTQPSLFGSSPATPAGSLFGQPQSQPSLFGAAPAQSNPSGSLFGQPQTQPSIFGAPSPAGSLFGQPAGTTTSFFGGASSTSSPAFGATAPAFGASSASASPFGSAPAAASWQPATSFFGATQSSTPSPFNFGFSSSPFGASSSSSPLASQPLGASSTPSLFGSSLPSFSFSTLSQSQPSAAPQLFGAGAGQASAPSSPFSFPFQPGAQQQQQQQQVEQQQQQQLLQHLMTPAAGSPHLGSPWPAAAQPQADVNSLAEGYNAATCGAPGASRASLFCHAFFNVTLPVARLRPPNVPDGVWNEAMARLQEVPAEQRHALWPEIVWGFEGLRHRQQAQDDAMKADRERLQELEGGIGQLSAHLDSLLASRANQARQRQEQLRQRLLRLMHLVEVLQLHSASAPLSASELNLVARLRNLVQALRGPADLPRRVDSVLSAAQAERWDPQQGSSSNRLDQPGSAELLRVLGAQSEAIAKLVSTAASDSQALAILCGDAP